MAVVDKDVFDAHLAAFLDEVHEVLGLIPAKAPDVDLSAEVGRLDDAKATLDVALASAAVEAPAPAAAAAPVFVPPTAVLGTVDPVTGAFSPGAGPGDTAVQDPATGAVTAPDGSPLPVPAPAAATTPPAEAPAPVDETIPAPGPDGEPAPADPLLVPPAGIEEADPAAPPAPGEAV